MGGGVAKTELDGALRPCRRAGLLLAVMTGLRSLLFVALAFSSRGVLNSRLGDGKFPFWCIALIMLSIAAPLLGGFMNAWSGRVTDKRSADLRTGLLQLLKSKDCESVNGYHSGHLYSRLTVDCRAVCQQYTGLLPSMAGQATQLLAAFAALVFLRPPLAAVLAVCGAAAGALGFAFRRFLKRRSMDERRADERLTAELQEALEQQEVLRSVADADETARRFDSCQGIWLRARETLRKFSVGGWTGFSIIVYIGSAAVILWGTISIKNGSLSIGDLTAILQLIALFRAPVTGLTGIHSQLAAVDAARERIGELYSLPDEVCGEEVPADARALELIFRNVTFSYSGEERGVLQNFSARIPLDRWSCLTGDSGRGKSTLYRLILATCRPQSGSIILETDRGEYPCSKATRRFFGYVPQTPALLSGTIRENLLMARPDADEEELWAALLAADCGFVSELPKRMDTEIGEEGRGLSAGQRQRVAIARALLGGAQVLLLDEITSALDRDTELRVLENLRERIPAAIAATHHPEMLNEPDVSRLELNEQ